MGLSIRTKLVLAFFLILFATVAFELYLLFITQSVLRQTVGQDSVSLAVDTIGRIDKDIYLKIEEIQLYSQDVSLESALKESNKAFDGLENADMYIREQDEEWTSAPKDAVTPFMRELIASSLSDTLRREFIGFWDRKYGYQIYGEAFITNKYGANIAQTGKTSDYWQADEEWWKEAKRKGFYVSGFEYDESAKAWSMPISVRIDDAQGNFLGVIKTVPLAREMVREVEPGAQKYNTTEIVLITQEGKLIYSTKAFQVFEDVSSEEFFGNIKTGSGFFVAKGGGGKEKLFAYAQSRGFRNFEGLKWILLLAHDTAEVFSPVRQLQNTLATTSAMLFLMIGLLVFMLVRAISSPIQKLTKAANYIARGNLGVRIDINTKDEIGELARTFNAMTEKLKESYRDLERKVKERTEELEERIYELDKTTKLLVWRDVELSRVRETLQGQIGEMDKISKRLVRRDFELLQANETLREMDEAKSRFVSIAAHQLRTPLAGIKWTVQMFLSGDFGKVTKGQIKAFQDALVALERLTKLIGDLLNVARIEGGKFKFAFSSVHIEEVCRKVFNESIAEAKNRGISMNLRLFQESLPRVRGDFENLAIALQNIVDNAIAYTGKGGVIDITVKKDPRDLKRVRISVQDTGMGIPDEQKGLVGQKFFRADNAVREQIPGTGLGLYIVNRILEQHEGSLQIESEEGKGSVFSFTLPFVEG